MATRLSSACSNDTNPNKEHKPNKWQAAPVDISHRLASTIWGNILEFFDPRFVPKVTNFVKLGNAKTRAHDISQFAETCKNWHAEAVKYGTHNGARIAYQFRIGAPAAILPLIPSVEELLKKASSATSEHIFIRVDDGIKEILEKLSPADANKMRFELGKDKNRDLRFFDAFTTGNSRDLQRLANACSEMTMAQFEQLSGSALLWFVNILGYFGKHKKLDEVLANPNLLNRILPAIADWHIECARRLVKAAIENGNITLLDLVQRHFGVAPFSVKLKGEQESDPVILLCFLNSTAMHDTTITKKVLDWYYKQPKLRGHLTDEQINHDPLIRGLGGVAVRRNDLNIFAWLYEHEDRDFALATCTNIIYAATRITPQVFANLVKSRMFFPHICGTTSKTNAGYLHLIAGWNNCQLMTFLYENRNNVFCKGKLFPANDNRGLSVADHALKAGHTEMVNLLASFEGDWHSVPTGLVKPPEKAQNP